MKEKCSGVEKTETNQEILTGRVFRTGACKTLWIIYAASCGFTTWQ